MGFCWIAGLLFLHLITTSDGRTSKDELKQLERGDGRILLGSILGNVDMIQLGIKEQGNVNSILEPYLASLIMKKDESHKYLPSCPAVHLALFMGKKDHLNSAFYLIRMGADLNHFKLPARRMISETLSEDILGEISPYGYPPAFLYGMGLGHTPTNTQTAVIQRLFQTFPEKFNVTMFQEYLQLTGNPPLLQLTVLADNFDGSYLIVSNAMFLRSNVSDSSSNRRLGIDDQDRDGVTALHIAAWNNNIRTMVLLLFNHADFLIADRNGRTALHYAAMRGHATAANLLVDSAMAEAKTGPQISQARQRQYSLLSAVDADGHNAFQIATDMFPELTLVSKALRVHCSNHNVSTELTLTQHSSPQNVSAKLMQLVQMDSGGWHCTYSTLNSSPRPDVISDDSSEQCTLDDESNTCTTIEQQYNRYEISSLSATNITSDHFQRDFFSTQRPLVITHNLTANNGIWSHWTQDSFMQRNGNMLLRTVDDTGAGDVTRNDTVRLTGRVIPLSHYVNRYMTGGDGLSGPMGFTDAASLQMPSLRHTDLAPPEMFQLCPSSADKEVVDSFDTIDRENTQQPFALNIGPAGSTLPMQTLNALWTLTLFGARTFYLIAPGHRGAADELLKGIQLNGTAIRNTEDWITIIAPQLERRRLMQKVTVFPGDVLFIPHHWSHVSEHHTDALGLTLEFCTFRNTDHRFQPLGSVVYGGVDPHRGMGRVVRYREVVTEELARSLKWDKRSKFPTFAIPNVEK